MQASADNRYGDRRDFMSRHTIRTALIPALALLVATTSAQAGSLTVRDSWTPSGLQAAWHWAEEKGLFAAEGISVRHDDGTGSGTTMQLVATGQYDVGHGDVSVMAIARERGMPLVAIGGLIQATSLGVFVPADSDITRLEDLRGKTLLYTATSFEGPFMDTFLARGGLDRSSVNLMSVDSASKIPTYASGNGDAMVTSIPFGTPFVQPQRASNHLTFGDYGLSLPSYGLVVNESTLAEKSDALGGLVRAYYLAWEQIIAGGDDTIREAAEIITKYRPDNAPPIETLIWSINEHIKYFRTENNAGLPLGAQADADWAGTVATLQEAGLVDAARTPGEFYTNRHFD
jgi:NitT/TauT family transport system substrate-binding protein